METVSRQHDAWKKFFQWAFNECPRLRALIVSDFLAHGSSVSQGGVIIKDHYYHYSCRSMPDSWYEVGRVKLCYRGPHEERKTIIADSGSWEVHAGNPTPVVPAKADEIYEMFGAVNAPSKPSYVILWGYGADINPQELLRLLAPITMWDVRRLQKAPTRSWLLPILEQGDQCVSRRARKRLLSE